MFFYEVIWCVRAVFCSVLSKVIQDYFAFVFGKDSLPEMVPYLSLNQSGVNDIPTD